MRGFRCQEGVRSGERGFDANHLRWCRLIKPWFTAFDKNKERVAALLALTTASHPQTQEPLKGLRLEISLKKPGEQREDFARLCDEDSSSCRVAWLVWVRHRQSPLRAGQPGPDRVL
jgi:hypothetical protein